MSSNMYQRAKELLPKAAALDPAERTTFLDRACNGDDALREELHSLLQYVGDSQDDFSDTALSRGHELLSGALESQTLQSAADRALCDELPTSIGQYRVVRLVGEGGMGQVFEAEQRSPQRPVAVKLIRPGHLSRDMLRRFRHEADALGQLHHPGIAQIYEAGSACVERPSSGATTQPFFAMELVHGRALGDYAADTGLDRRARLELVAYICDAVQHAHQKGVIHRDLKPANILVTNEGRPKVLDFGVARINSNNGQTTLTRAGHLLGTLGYMSPEQAAGDWRALDTRSDVYSLGVILYELLAGRLPLDCRDCSLTEAARRIREEPPQPLSSLDSSLLGDVETIVAKTLEKEPARRYQSAGELARDIRRYLSGEAIEARRDSGWYVLRKTLFRYRWPLIALHLFFVLLGGFTIYAMSQAQRYRELASRERQASHAAAAAGRSADEQRQQAEAQAGQAQDVTRFLADMLGLSDPDITQSPDMTMRAMLDQASAEVEAVFHDQPEAEAMVRTVVGRAYATIGELEQARDHLARALQIRQHEIQSSRREIYEVLWPYVNVLRNLSEHDWHLQWLELQSFVPILVGEHQSELGAAMSEFAGEIQADQAPEELQASYEEMNKLAAAHLGERDPLWLNLADYIYSWTWQLGRGRRFDQACAFLTDALEIQRRFLPDTHTSIVQTRHKLVAFTLRDGRAVEAETLARESLQLMQKVLPEDHWHVSYSRAYLGACLTAQGRFEEAEALLLESYPRYTKARGTYTGHSVKMVEFLIDLYELWGRPEDASKYRMKLAAALMEIEVRPHRSRARAAFGPEFKTLWEALERLDRELDGNSEAAAAAVAEVLQMRRDLIADDHVISALFRDVLFPRLNSYVKRFGFDEHAYAAFDQLNEVCRANNFLHPIKKAEGPFWLGWAHETRGEYQEAERLVRESLHILGPHRDRTYHKGGLGDSLLGATLVGQERYTEAEPWLRQGYEILLDAIGPERRHTVIALMRLADLYQRWGRPERGEEIFRSHLHVLLQRNGGARELNRWSWRIVQTAELPRYAYEVAAEAVRRAAELSPKNGEVMTTLGAALFRLGRYEQALEALLHAQELYAGVGRSDAVFLSMTHQRLGRTSEATAWLAHYRERLATRGSNATYEALLLEATALIEPGQSP